MTETYFTLQIFEPGYLRLVLPLKGVKDRSTNQKPKVWKSIIIEYASPGALRWLLDKVTQWVPNEGFIEGQFIFLFYMRSVDTNPRHQNYH